MSDPALADELKAGHGLTRCSVMIRD